MKTSPEGAEMDHRSGKNETGPHLLNNDVL